MAIINKLSEEDHKKSKLVARLMYAMVMLVFVSVCTIAVIACMKMESEKEGFRPITVKQPISFIDKTYLKKEDK